MSDCESEEGAMEGLAEVFEVSIITRGGEQSNRLQIISPGKKKKRKENVPLETRFGLA